MPILNRRDYRTAKARAAQLTGSVGRSAVIQNMTDHLPADVSDARQRALKAELDRLSGEIEAYEKLQQVDDLPEGAESDDLGLLPILARIARRLSQRELAELLGVKEQQIQRYENERYAGIALRRYKQTLEVLGVEVQPRLLTPWSASSKGERTPAENVFDPSLLREIKKRSWFGLDVNSDNTSLVKALDNLVQEGRQLSRNEALHRKSPREDSIVDDLALSLWHARVLNEASQRRSKLRMRFNLADTQWVQQLVQLSIFDDGPKRAEEFLREKGIILVVEPHLPRTHLDGAAFVLSDGTPVIGVTLRHDRVDNFWFVLLHELGHILLHFNHGLEKGFMDDLDVQSEDKKEKEADSFARTALIPDALWNTSSARFAKAIEPIRKFAVANKMHPAIVIGRIMRDRNDYSKFRQWVGQGEVRRLFVPN